MALSNLEKTILDTIAYYEGTLGKSQNGFDILFGGKKIINGWTENTTEIRHRCIKPRGTVTEQVILDEGFTVCEDPTWEGTTSYGSKTTAAGRYQYLGYSWASTTKKIGLGFNAPMSSDNQNKAALRGVKVKRKVKDSELQNALTSISNFKKVLEKLKEEWTSMKNALNGNYHKTVEMGWEFYKGAYGKYNSPNAGTQSNLNSSNGTTIYIDSDGNTIPKFGTSTTSTNTVDSDKFYVNIPGDNTANKIIFFWCGLESVISRKKQWDQIPSNVKEKNYIIMGNYLPNVDGSTNITNDGLRTPFKRYFSSIGGDYSKIKSKILMGYSAGGAIVFNNYSTSDKFCGLIDPSLSTEANTENRTYSSNVAMLWGSDGMIGINNWATRYPKVQSKIKDGKGFVIKIPKLDHGIAIQKWFELWGSVLTTGQSPTNNTNSSDTTPNAGQLRSVMNNLNIKEKKYTTQFTINQIKALSSNKRGGDGPNYIVPTKDPNTGNWKVLLNQSYTDGEMSNAGDITESLSKAASAVFSKIYELTNIKITVTGGNDNYHQSYNNSSRHRLGKGIDFTVSPHSTTDLDRVITIIQSFVGGEYPYLRYIDEYRYGTTNGTGNHFHMSWGDGAEGQSTAIASKTKTDNNQIPTYTV